MPHTHTKHPLLRQPILSALLLFKTLHPGTSLSSGFTQHMVSKGQPGSLVGPMGISGFWAGKALRSVIFCLETFSESQ